MKRIFYAVFCFSWMLLCFSEIAWGQGAYGERQFYNQLNSVRNQVRPHFKQARQYMGQLRQQGVNTSGWERQLNWIESQLNNMRWTGPSGGRGGTGFQTINPFGDYLFHGVPIRPQDGKLVTRQWDPDGLAARAEEWAKELRGLSKDINTRQGAERKQFVGELNERLTQLAAITNQQLQLADLSGGQQLKPQTGEDVSLAGLPRLQGDTPALLRDPFGRDDPTMAPVSGKPGIDDIYVPLPPPTISAVDACAGGAACIMGALASEGIGWMQEKYWDAKTWYNDPMHQGWVSDAVMIGTAPLIVRDAFAAGSRIILGAGTADASLITIESRAPQLLAPPTELKLLPAPTLQTDASILGRPDFYVDSNGRVARRFFYDGNEIVGHMNAAGEISITTGEGYAPAFNRAYQRAMDAGLFSPGGKYYLPLGSGR